MGDQSNRKAVFIESSWKVSSQSFFLAEEIKEELELNCSETSTKAALNAQEKIIDLKGKQNNLKGYSQEHQVHQHQVLISC